MSRLYKHYVISERYNDLSMGLVNKKGQADRYDDPKTFGSFKAAKDWIKKHSYPGMSHYYRIYGVIDSKSDNNALRVCKYDQKEDKTEWERLHLNSKTSMQH